METLRKEVLIPIKISKRKAGSPTYFMKNQYVKTPLSKLLAKAYIMDKRLKENPKMQFREFCKINKVTPNYLSAVLQLNNLSPKLKTMIMNGFQPKHISIQDLLRAKVPLEWNKQESWMIKE